jgi:hypothetical protein
VREVLQALNENNFNPRIRYPAKLSFKIHGTIKVFHEKQKLKQYLTTIHHYKRFPKEFRKQKMKAKKTHERAGSTKPQEKKRQEIKE